MVVLNRSQPVAQRALLVIVAVVVALAGLTTVVVAGRTSTSEPRPAAPFEPGISSTQSCHDKLNPATAGSAPKDAATGLYLAWQKDDRVSAWRCATESAVTQLFDLPLVTASLQGCPPISGTGSARTTVCSLSTTTPPGVLSMRETCDDVGCVVAGVEFVAQNADRAQHCQALADSHGRLSPELLSNGVYLAWVTRDAPALASCASGQELQVLKAHAPVRLSASGCAEVDSGGLPGPSMISCTFKGPTSLQYLTIKLSCGASAGCQLDSVKFDDAAT